MFTIQEVVALRQLVDIAVKAAGMQVAQVACHLDKKLAEMIDQAAQEQQKPKVAVPNIEEARTDVQN